MRDEARRALPLAAAVRRPSRWPARSRVLTAAGRRTLLLLLLAAASVAAALVPWRRWRGRLAWRAASAAMALLHSRSAIVLVGSLSAGSRPDAGWGFWRALVAVWLCGLARRGSRPAPLSRDRRRSPTLANLAVPVLFGLTLLFLWECGVRGFGSSMMKVILPAPSAIAARFGTSLPTLGADFVQTFKGVSAGYVDGLRHAASSSRS